MINKFLKNNSVLFFATIFLISCGPEQLTPTDYLRWCDNTENGLIREFVQNDIILTCQYMSPSYSVLKQSDPNQLNEAEITENIEELNELVQFKLKFENTSNTNFLKDNYTTAEEFNTESMYLSYDIRTDLKLVIDQDTVLCNFNHHERTYGNTPYETLLIAFPKVDNNTITNLELIFNDRVFGLGRVKFFFDKEVLKTIPELIF